VDAVRQKQNPNTTPQVVRPAAGCNGIKGRKTTVPEGKSRFIDGTGRMFNSR
jgi:hypothetical protein